MLKKAFYNTKNSVFNFYSIFIASLLNIFVPIGKKSNWIFVGNIWDKSTGKTTTVKKNSRPKVKKKSTFVITDPLGEGGKA